jgi:DNA mismatch repair protein MutS2
LRERVETPQAVISRPHDASSGAPAVLDVRGQTTEEALDRVVAALDRATLLGLPTIRIIHGHGTGRLRSVLRDYLGRSEYVAALRPGERAEGGDGVTVVQLIHSP